MLKMFTASRRRPAFSSVFYVLCVLMVALSGCADNTIRLLFRPAPAGTVTDPYAPSLAVLRFEDKRPEVWIGQRMGENGGYFQAGSSVPEWVSRSLADELVLHGVKAFYAEDAQSAAALKPGIHDFRRAASGLGDGDQSHQVSGGSTFSRHHAAG